jgi:hypothetical protein
MKFFGRLSKVTQTQLGCSSLMFAVAHLCPKRDCSVRCAAAGDCAVVTILFLQIAPMIPLGVLLLTPLESALWEHRDLRRQLVVGRSIVYHCQELKTKSAFEHYDLRRQLVVERLCIAARS